MVDGEEMPRQNRPVRRWKPIGFSLVCCLGALALLWSSGAFEREPRYQGVPLSTWVYRLMQNDGVAEAEDAIRHIGPKAVPLLLRWLGNETPAWREKVAQRVYPIS